MTKPKIVFHYTAHQQMIAILESGVIKLATVGTEENEKPAVWFSSRNFWEPTATKMTREKGSNTFYQMSMQEQYERFGLARFILENDHLLSWDDFKQTSGISRAEARRLEKVAHRQGSDCQDFWCSYEPISIYFRCGVQICIDDIWTDLSEVETERLKL